MRLFPAPVEAKILKRKRRFVVVRQAGKVQQKQPVQLDLFVPSDYEWEFKIILTNKRLTPKIWLNITMDEEVKKVYLQN